MTKNDKIYSSSISIITGAALIVLGIIIYIFNVDFYNKTVFMAVIFSLINCLRHILKDLFKKTKKENLLLIFSSLIFSIVLLVIPSIPRSFLPLLFSSYLLLCSVFYFIFFLILLKDKGPKKFQKLFISIFYLIISVIIFLFPLKHVSFLLKLLAVYFITLGGFFITQAIYHLIPSKYKNIYKRKIRISLPVWLEAIVPYTVFIEINKMLKVEEKPDKINDNIDNNNNTFEVLVHVSPNGFNRVGHVDLVYGNKVISYGNYDDSSKKFYTIVGDGVLFYTDKETYIPFCMKHSNKVLFGFELNINDEQRKHIEQKLNELNDQLIEWTPPNINSSEELKKIDYASALYKSSKTKFYKFKKGKFKTYYLFGSSCCNLANELIGYSGIDFLKMNGLISPGSYYDCLNREYINKTGLVTKRNIYKLDDYNVK